MKQFKFLTVFLFLVTSYSSFSITLDNFEDSESGFGELNSNETDLSLLGITVKRERGVGTKYNSDTGNLQYDYGKYSIINYGLNPELDMKDIPIVRINFASIPSTSFSNAVHLTDDQGDYISLASQVVNNQQDFNFGNVFNTFKYPGQGDFNFHKIQKIAITLNSTGGIGPAYNPVTFEIESIEAVPEPFSLVSLGTGFAAFVKRKRSGKTKKNSKL